MAEFIGETNLLSGTVEGWVLCTAHGRRLAIPAGLAEDHRHCHPRHLYGADLHLHVTPEGGGPEIGVIARDSAAAPREGATVTLGYDSATMHLMEGVA